MRLLPVITGTISIAAMLLMAYSVGYRQARKDTEQAAIHSQQSSVVYCPPAPPCHDLVDWRFR